MDKVDLEIVKIISKNARTPFRKIAKQLNISPQMVSRRYEKLKKTTFAYTSITVNLEKLGFKAAAVFSLKISRHQQCETNKIYDTIVQSPNVIVANKVLGTFSMYCLVPVRSFEEVFEFQNYLAAIEGIDEIEMTLYKIHKNWPRQLYNKLLEEQN
ncbi:MAG: Lrp/AsnC family transcriptional regulator [Crenarchaeota archaeon]|nr:Lrp/AsnC family transcriptional regulator [Thermoproteota archaeon]